MHSRGKAGLQREWVYLLLLPLVALFVALPLQLRGPSCGHDFAFHTVSWLDAAQQFREGHFFLRWTASAAYRAGEPRFLFYPPLSWMTGGLLALLFPLAHTSAIFIWLVLSCAGATMYRLARDYATPGEAIFCASLYAVNPYMVLMAVERSAFGELLSAIWLPLLLRGLLRRRPTAAGVAVPLALIWLTNVPTAALASYLVGFVLVMRFVLFSNLNAGDRTSSAAETRQQTTLSLAGGWILGTLLPAFYLLPAAYERRYVQYWQAFTIGHRIADGIPFHRTGQPWHDGPLLRVSYIAVAGLLIAAGLLWTLLRRGSTLKVDVADSPTAPLADRPTAVVLACAMGMIGFGLTPLSLPFWHLPALTFVQFPTRLLSLLFPLLTIALAITCHQKRWNRFPLLWFTPVAAFLLAFPTQHRFRQDSIPPDLDRALARLFASHHGFRPTPEYTVVGASDVSLHTDDPDHWLASDLSAAAPGTRLSPGPDLKDANFVAGATPDQTLSASAPVHLAVQTATPQFLVLNLRDFPAWRVLRNGMELPHQPRPDGLLAVALPSGDSIIDVQWKEAKDLDAGLALSALALLGLLLTRHRRLAL